MAQLRTLTRNVKRSIVAAVVTGIVALCGSSDAYAAGVPGHDDASTSDDRAIEKKKHKHHKKHKKHNKNHLKPVVLDHFMIAAGNLGEIIPCIKVLRDLYAEAQANPDLMIRVKVSYFSNGTKVTRVNLKPLDVYLMSDHHSQPTQFYWLVETDVDVTAEPVDPGSPLTGTAELVVASGPGDAPGS